MSRHLKPSALARTCSAAALNFVKVVSVLHPRLVPMELCWAAIEQ